MRILGKPHSTNLQSLSDLELVKLYKSRADQSVIGEFYQRYQHIVFGVCLKYMKDIDKSNDAMMHVYQELFDYLAKYEIKEFKSWLLTIARNHCLRILKNENHHIELNEITEKNNSVGFMENEEEIAHLKEKEKLFDHLGDSIEQLKEEQKVCIKLFYLKSMSYQEVCEETGFELKKVKSFIQNGKRNLQIMLEKQR